MTREQSPKTSRYCPGVQPVISFKSWPEQKTCPCAARTTTLSICPFQFCKEQTPVRSVVRATVRCACRDDSKSIGRPLLVFPATILIHAADDCAHGWPCLRFGFINSVWRVNSNDVISARINCFGKKQTEVNRRCAPIFRNSANRYARQRQTRNPRKTVNLPRTSTSPLTDSNGKRCGITLSRTLFP